MIIRSIRRYEGVGCLDLRGKRVVVVAVHRGDVDRGEILRDDATIGSLEADDRFEFVQIIPGPDGADTTTWVTADAAAWELGPAEGRWDGPIMTTKVFERLSDDL